MQGNAKDYPFNSKTKKPKKKSLGKGLDALIPDLKIDGNSSNEYFRCDISLIQNNPHQPRMSFAQAELEELCLSIRTQGIIQPLIVRKNDSGYELIAGERRFRAAKMAGLQQVPVILKDITDIQMLEMSIIENVQRKDLNPMEEAEAYNLLMTAFNLTQDEIAQRIGKSRSAIANFLRLRQLPEQIKAGLMDGKLSMGHARALLGADTPAQQNAAWRLVIAKTLSVRETENLVKRLKAKEKKKKTLTTNSEEIYLSGVADELSRYFGSKVLIKQRGQKGKVEIEFYSNDDLDRLLGLLKHNKNF